MRFFCNFLLVIITFCISQNLYAGDLEKKDYGSVVLKADLIKYDDDLVKIFCEYNKCSKAEYELILSIHPKEVEKEMDMYCLMLKAKKNNNIVN